MRAFTVPQDINVKPHPESKDQPELLTFARWFRLVVMDDTRGIQSEQGQATFTLMQRWAKVAEQCQQAAGARVTLDDEDHKRLATIVEAPTRLQPLWLALQLFEFHRAVLEAKEPAPAA